MQMATMEKDSVFGYYKYVKVQSGQYTGHCEVYKPDDCLCAMNSIGSDNDFVLSSPAQ